MNYQVTYHRALGDVRPGNRPIPTWQPDGDGRGEQDMGQRHDAHGRVVSQHLQAGQSSIAQGAAGSPAAGVACCRPQMQPL
eukprot:scaffold8119_cov444-Prasinococcus_capsulatus_cf.AAC.5